MKQTRTKPWTVAETLPSFVSLGFLIGVITSSKENHQPISNSFGPMVMGIAGLWGFIWPLHHLLQGVEGPPPALVLPMGFDVMMVGPSCSYESRSFCPTCG